MGIVELLLLAVGLAMDAFAVSICKGLALQKVAFKDSLICGLWFGIFQALMPLLGYFLGSGFESYIHSVAPWVGFVLLLFIGINMIREAFGKEEKQNSNLGFKTMVILAIATSIDALAVGITFACVPVVIIQASALSNALLAVGIIGIVTFILCCIAVRVGSLFGSKYGSKAEFAGGLILILIGVKIILESYGLI